MAGEDEDETEIPDDQDVRSDREETAKLAAIYIDSYWLTIWNQLIRITFGEDLGGEVRYRSSIVMPWRDAEAMARQVLRMIENRRKRIEAEATATPPVEPPKTPKS